MAKIVVECTDPNDLEAVEKASEQIMGRCNITYFKNAQTRVEVGTAKSLNEAAKQIAEETGESKRAVESRVYRGKDNVPHVAEQSITTTNNKEILNNQTIQEKSNVPESIPQPAKDGTMRGGPREGAGRKPTVNKPTFNETNENIDWAKWSWNPVTGCLHGCKYCYARDIANRFYKEKFEPTFRPHRLTAPYNTHIPKDRQNEPGIHNVFVCSMADLFGDWVKQEWIDAVLKKVKDTPQWNYIFLTKNPKRYIEIEWPDNALVGTTVDVQSRVAPAEEAFEQIDARIKFLSCEPFLEELTFSNIGIFDWVLIGSQSKSSQCPAFQPERQWILSLITQAWDCGCPIYCKPNLKPVKDFPDLLNK